MEDEFEDVVVVDELVEKVFDDRKEGLNLCKNSSKSKDLFSKSEYGENAEDDETNKDGGDSI